MTWLIWASVAVGAVTAFRAMALTRRDLGMTPIAAPTWRQRDP